MKGGKLNMENSGSLINDSQHKRFIDDRVACMFGVVESIILEQLRYWIKLKSENPKEYKNCFIDGRWWVFNTYSEWHNQLPFYSEVTIRRAFKNLEKHGVVITAKYNKKGYDNTKWFTIDFDLLEKLLSEEKASDQNDQIMCSKRSDDAVKMTRPIPITTTTITPKNSFYYRVGFEKTDNCISDNELDMGIVYRQIDKACDTLEIDCDDRKSVKEIFLYFYTEYRKFTGKDHVNLSDRNILKVVNNFVKHDCDYGYIDYDVYKQYIQDYFYGNNHFVNGCNYSIIHFSETLEIREYNFEKSEYADCGYLPF